MEALKEVENIKGESEGHGEKSLPKAKLKTCNHCKEEILASATKCKFCQSNLGVDLSVIFAFGKLGLVGLACYVGFLMSFHAVESSGKTYYIPKERLNFAGNTIDLDAYLNRYNESSGRERIRISGSHLHIEMMERGIIVSRETNE